MKDLLKKVKEIKEKLPEKDKKLAEELGSQIGDVIVALGGERPPTGGDG